MQPTKLLFKALIFLAIALTSVRGLTHVQCQEQNFDYKNEINSSTPSPTMTLSEDSLDVITMSFDITPGIATSTACYTRVLLLVDAFAVADQTLTIITSEALNVEAFSFDMTEAQIKERCTVDTL